MALTKDSAITVDADILKFTFEIGLLNLLDNDDVPFDTFNEHHKLAVNEVIDWLLLHGVKASAVTNPSDFMRAAIYQLCCVVFLGVSQRPEDEYWMKSITYCGKFEGEMLSQLVQLEEGKEYPRAKGVVVANIDTYPRYIKDDNPTE